tara:strand:+ start:6767 stop:8503 length:1737 start_codon:yes stop_codon:yes gene_type:complete
MRKNLIFFYNTQNLRSSENYTLYGNYNKYENPNLKSSNVDFFEKKNISNEELMERYDFCEKIFLKVLNKLTIELNKIHKTNHSSRFWEILLGKFLRHFIYTVFNSYSDLTEILKNQNIKDIFLIDTKKYKLFVENTFAQSFCKLDDNWIAALNSKIVDQMSITKSKFFSDSKKKFFKLPKELDNQKVENKTLKYFSNFFNYLFKKNQIIIYLSGMPFLFEKYLEYKLKQFPSFYCLNDFDYKTYNSEMRSNINFNLYKFENEFEKILISLIPEALPLYILENFKDLENSVNSSNLNKNPKIIFTSLGYAYDEVFKFYIAKNCEKNSKFFVMQHGNNYFTDIHTKYLSELKSSDKFISWGKEDPSNNVHSGFNLKTVRKIKYNQNSNYLSVLTNPIIFESAPYNRDYLNKLHLINTSNLLSNLEDKIKKQTRIKIHYGTLIDKNINYYEGLFELKGFKLYNSKKNIKSVINNSRLCLFNYESTGVFENLAMNIPTIFYLNSYNNRLNKSYENTYSILKNIGIFFDDEKKMIKHINNVWNNIHEWWYDDKTQGNIKKFNMELNIPFKNSEKFTNFFKKEI